MRKLLIAAALLLTATPALADWAPTRWGMTPEQVVAAVPGAVQNERKADGDLWGLYRLVEAPTVDAAINLRVRFYFEPGSRKLKLVDLLPVKMDECPAYREAMVARYGETRVERRSIDTGYGMRDAVSLHWTDPGSGDKLSFAGIFFEGSDTEYGICKMLREPRK